MRRSRGGVRWTRGGCSGVEGGAAEGRGEGEGWREVWERGYRGVGGVRGGVWVS